MLAMRIVLGVVHQILLPRSGADVAEHEDRGSLPADRTLPAAALAAAITTAVGSGPSRHQASRAPPVAR